MPKVTLRDSRQSFEIGQIVTVHDEHCYIVDIKPFKVLRTDNGKTYKVFKKDIKVVKPIKIDLECAEIAKRIIVKKELERIEALEARMEKVIKKAIKHVKTPNPSEGRNMFCCRATFEKEPFPYAWDELCPNGYSQYECASECDFPCRI